MKIKKKDWKKIWEEFARITSEAYERGECPKCGSRVKAEYTAWEDQQGLIEKLVNKFLKEK